MTGLGLERLVRLFVEPDDLAASVRRTSETAATSRTVARAPSVALLAAPGELRLAANALALTLARRHRVPAALVLQWTDGGATGPSAAQLAMPAARRVAGIAAEHGCEAHARGRVATAILPSDEGDAVPLARVVLGQVAAPAVLALSGVRSAVWDPLLEAHDLIVVAVPAGAGEALRDVALSSAARLDPPAALLTVGCGALRGVPDGGLVLTPPLRRAAEAALEMGA